MSGKIIWFVLLAGFVARLFGFWLDYPFGGDVWWFQSWAMRIFEVGFREFFLDEAFNDYPPVYLYVLYLIGAIRAGVRAVFGEQYWYGFHSMGFRLAVFMPSILSDLGIGFVLYKITLFGKATFARDAETDAAPTKSAVYFALFVAGAWIFNPSIILISSVWGQVESVFVLMLLISLLLLRDGKLLPAYILFGLAIFTKPQSLFLASVYLYSAYDFLQTHKFTRDSCLKLAGSVLAGAGVMVLVSLPFGLVNTFEQLTFGMGLHALSSVNASNFWAMIGENWSNLDTMLFGAEHGTWGFLIVLIIIFGSLYALHIDRTKHDGKHFFLIVTVLLTSIFTFSVRMHERYLFPAILFMLVYYLENRQRRDFIIYWGLSAVYFLNCLEVLRWANGDAEWGDVNAAIRAFGFVMVLIGSVLIFVMWKTLRGGYEKEAAPVESSSKKSAFASKEKPPPMRQRDYIHIILLVAVYSIVAFSDLGDFQVPQTTWVSDETPYARLDFGGEVYISQFQFYMGAKHDGHFEMHGTIDGENWEQIFYTHYASVFAWRFEPLHRSVRYVALFGSNGIRIQEIAFRGANNEILPVAAFLGGENLVDEQHLVPETRNFMNSTYFDEIYHPRTGYEFVHGLRVYETTHPPLGKVFMAASIRIFGMTPFGWRLPGTIFGAMMLPLIYAFARMLLKSNNFALFATFIFAFDFMLFSHSRLATIDGFVTFFVIAMYFFMYWYTTGLERHTLKKSLIILALCGASMGLAIASKWQGVYGAIGLPILFFPALYKLYLRDPQQAKITFLSCFGIFLAVPLVIYVLSYIPFVYSMATPERGFFATIWDNQVNMFNYHSHLVAEHPFASVWWTWPIIRMPLWQYQTIISDTVRAGMSSLGSPAVWWMGILATVFAIYSLSKKSRFEYETVFLLVAYAANFLPWVFITRLTFIYHYFPSLPFVVLLIALFFRRYVKRDWLCITYAGIVFALFVLFYPVLAGAPVEVEFVDTYLRWFRNWHLV